jgi:hypothetical protein
MTMFTELEELWMVKIGAMLQPSGHLPTELPRWRRYAMSSPEQMVIELVTSLYRCLLNFGSRVWVS